MSVRPPPFGSAQAEVAFCGRALGRAWLEAVAPLYSRHMGCENMGPLLYSLARFVKPRSCLEIGAGYTSAFLLQALEDSSCPAAWGSEERHQDADARRQVGLRVSSRVTFLGVVSGEAASETRAQSPKGMLNKFAGGGPPKARI